MWVFGSNCKQSKIRVSSPRRVGPEIHNSRPSQPPSANRMPLLTTIGVIQRNADSICDKISDLENDSKFKTRVYDDARRIGEPGLRSLRKRQHDDDGAHKYVSKLRKGDPRVTKKKVPGFSSRDGGGSIRRWAIEALSDDTTSADDDNMVEVNDLSRSPRFISAASSQSALSSISSLEEDDDNACAMTPGTSRELTSFVASYNLQEICNRQERGNGRRYGYLMEEPPFLSGNTILCATTTNPSTLLLPTTPSSTTGSTAAGIYPGATAHVNDLAHSPITTTTTPRRVLLFVGMVPCPPCRPHIRPGLSIDVVVAAGAAVEKERPDVSTSATIKAQRENATRIHDDGDVLRDDKALRKHVVAKILNRRPTGTRINETSGRLRTYCANANANNDDNDSAMYPGTSGMPTENAWVFTDSTQLYMINLRRAFEESTYEALLTTFQVPRVSVCV